MKNRILIVLVLLCTFAQGAWADKWDGKTLTNTVFDQTLVFTRATEEQIKWYQDEADAWYGGADGDGHPVTGVGEGWNWVGEIAATAVDR